MKQETITIELLCACGKKCGELVVPANHPAGPDPKKHGIEKVECDDCGKARKYVEDMKNGKQ